MALPISKLIKEVATEVPKTLEEVATKTVPKVANRTRRLAKDTLPEENFIDIRQQDIKLDKRDTFLKGVELNKKIKQVEAATLYEPKISSPPKDPRWQALQERKRNLYLKAHSLQLEEVLTKSYKDMRAEGYNPYQAVKNIISNTAGVGRTFSNIEGRNDAIYTRLSRDLFDLKDELRTKVAGLKQNTELAEDVIRYLKDGDTQNSLAVKIGKQWKNAAEKAKALRAKAGGRIGDLEDWIMPQTHVTEKISKAGYNKWRESILPKLDVARIESEQGANIEDILKSAYKNITARQVETLKISKPLAKKHEESRILHFKDGQSIIDYNKEFGNPDIYASMDAHLRVQSNEIATMQLFGAKPEDNFEKLLELGRNDLKNGKDGIGSIEEGDLRAIWNSATGEIDKENIVNNLDRTIASISGGFRALKISSLLGTATIASIADVGNIVLGAGYRGLNSFKIFGKGLETLLQEAVSGMSTGANHEFATRLGIISEFANASLQNSRFAEQGSGWLARRAENVIRASGLGAWTDALRTGFGLELTSNIYKKFDTKIDDLSFGNLLKEYGIDEKAWDIIRSTKGRDIKGTKFLDIEAVYNKDEEIGYKLSEMITQEMNNFIIMPNSRVRAMSTWGEKKGTIKGEIARDIALFRSYPVSVMMLHMNRMGTMSVKGKLAYGSATIMSSVIFGGVALWAHDLVTGKTFRSYDRPEFVIESILKGGGLGIFADMFINPDNTKYGRSWGGMLLGVPFSTLEDLKGTFADIVKMNPKGFANAYNRAKGYIPGQNLWYTRLAVEKTIGQAIGEMIDPDYHKKRRKWERKMKKRDQKYRF